MKSSESLRRAMIDRCIILGQSQEFKLAGLNATQKNERFKKLVDVRYTIGKLIKSVFSEQIGQVSLLYFVKWSKREGDEPAFALLPGYEEQLCNKFNAEYVTDYDKKDYDFIFGSQENATNGGDGQPTADEEANQPSERTTLLLVPDILHAKQHERLM